MLPVCENRWQSFFMSRTISRVMSLSDHLSSPIVADRLEQPTQKHSGQLYCFLFGLASGGVYRALTVTSQAVSSYLAFPSLPLSRRFLSVALSLGSPPAAVSSYSVSVKPGLSSGSPCGLSRRRMFHSFSKRV